MPNATDILHLEKLGIKKKRRTTKYPRSTISPLSASKGGEAKVFPEIQGFFTLALQSMIEKNKALLTLINGLELEEI